MLLNPVSQGMSQMATYGYARVSREDQELALQVDALVAAGVAPGNIVRDKMSGVADRPRFTKLLDKLQAGDTLVTWKVDRLGRSALDTLRTFKELDEKGVRLIVTTLGHRYQDDGWPARSRHHDAACRVRARADHRAHQGRA